MSLSRKTKFRSTGSYEPDHPLIWKEGSLIGFDPQALTSLTNVKNNYIASDILFRSTGSYEPDHNETVNYWQSIQFRSTGSYEPDLDWVLTEVKEVVSIHRLLRA